LKPEGLNVFFSTRDHHFSYEENEITCARYDISREGHDLSCEELNFVTLKDHFVARQNEHLHKKDQKVAKKNMYFTSRNDVRHKKSYKNARKNLSLTSQNENPDKKPLKSAKKIVKTTKKNDFSSCFFSFFFAENSFFR